MREIARCDVAQMVSAVINRKRILMSLIGSLVVDRRREAREDACVLRGWCEKVGARISCGLRSLQPRTLEKRLK